MAKNYVIYIPNCDGIMLDGGVPYIDEEREVKRVIAQETVQPKNYEAKPVAFLKAWQKRQDLLEEEEAAKDYKFSPPAGIESGYRAKPTANRYLLIVADATVAKSGSLVKSFDTQMEAAAFAATSTAKLVKAYPKLGYFIYDAEQHRYI